jgi:hypothetical protein
MTVKKRPDNSVRPRIWACPGKGTLPVRVRVVRKHQRSDTRGGSNLRCLCIPNECDPVKMPFSLMSDKLTHLMGVMLDSHGIDFFITLDDDPTKLPKVIDSNELQ